MMMESIHALISPVVLTVASIIIMMQIAFWRNPRISWLLSCVTFLVALALLLPQLNWNAVGDSAAMSVTPLLISDQYSIFFSVLIVFAGLVTSVLARDYLHTRTGENDEFYLLLILATLGALILVSSVHLASFLLGLELLGVALYALIAYPERGRLPLEAAVKYLILSGAASAILLFGFALIYAALGTLEFTRIGAELAQVFGSESSDDKNIIILLGTAMILTGIGFKLSVVPFHMWTPDVYQGAPAPVTAFLATVSKGAIFAALLRLFVNAELYQYQGLILSLSLIAVASMLAGNLLALRQNNLKRLLAYSSIAHLGYLIITLVVYASSSSTQLAIEATGFYLTAYIVTSLAAFALLAIISSHGADRSNVMDAAENDDIESITGLFWRQPLLALLMTIALLSLAGIPLTAGFVGKFYLIAAGISAGLWVLISALLIGSGIGIYYYLRIIFNMTQRPTDEQAEQLNGQLSAVSVSVIMVLIGGMLYFGIFPQALIEYLGSVVL